MDTNESNKAVDNIQEEKFPVVVKLLQSAIPSIQKSTNVTTANSSDKVKNETDKIIKTANNKFLIEILSPEIKENEKKKRTHKDALMIAMGVFLTIQFAILFWIVGYTLFSILSFHKNHNPLDNSTIQIILGFIGVYITSVVVELIAILKYIVKNVFDTSIAGLVESFKDK